MLQKHARRTLAIAIRRPVIVLPSTSEPTLGSGKWSLGPTVVVLKQDGPWTLGALWNQTWSFSGDPSRVFPAHPDIGPSWKIRGAIVILLPKSRK